MKDDDMISQIAIATMVGDQFIKCIRQMADDICDMTEKRTEIDGNHVKLSIAMTSLDQILLLFTIIQRNFSHFINNYISTSEDPEAYLEKVRSFIGELDDMQKQVKEMTTNVSEKTGLLKEEDDKKKLN